MSIEKMGATEKKTIFLDLQKEKIELDKKKKLVEAKAIDAMLTKELLKSDKNIQTNTETKPIKSAPPRYM